MGPAAFLVGVAVTSGRVFTIIVCWYPGVEGTHHHTEHTYQPAKRDGPKLLNMPIISQNTNSETCRAFLLSRVPLGIQLYFLLRSKSEKAKHVKEGIFETRSTPDRRQNGNVSIAYKDITVLN